MLALRNLNTCKVTSSRETLSVQDNSNTYTKFCNYNRVKELICNRVLLIHDRELPSIRHIAQSLNVAKSSISRIILTLSDESWLRKESSGSSPRTHTYYITASFEQCSDFINYYFISSKRKRDFKKSLNTCGTKQLEGTTVNIAR